MWSEAEPKAVSIALVGVAGIYAVAFASLVVQVIPLLGARGLTPIADVVSSNPRLGGFIEAPSVLWLPGFSSDGALLALGWVGLVVALLLITAQGFGGDFTVSTYPKVLSDLTVSTSSKVLSDVTEKGRSKVLGLAVAGAFALLWVLYLSFVQLGDRWYGYGWETLLLEAGMLTTVLAATRSRTVLLLYRWLTFRLMFGAGLIKLRGDACWRDLTCLRYHFETQPIPNPLSWYLHHLPPWILDAGVGWNHVVELIVPWGLFFPKTRRIAAWLILHFQAVLILSGNLSFFNWLTLAICLPIAVDHAPAVPTVVGFRKGLTAAYVGLVALLSVGPMLNMLSPGQQMNASFDRLYLVNTYGAFGSVGRERDEVILEGWDGTQWKEWEFPYKPGSVDRMPGIIAPFQPRLDWQIWFAAMQPPARNLWVIHLMYQLLEGQPSAKQLLSNDPFPAEPPQRVRAELYRYRFTDPGEPGWWHRERLGVYVRAFSLEDPDLQALVADQGW
jgi:hypothetical protein